MSEKQKLLIVDDSELNRDILKEILGSSYDYLAAENGTQDEWIPGVGTYEGVTVD